MLRPRLFSAVVAYLSWKNLAALGAVVLAAGLVAAKNVENHSAHEILNASYDPTRELYQEVNARFIEKRFRETGVRPLIKQSHGGSSHQTRLVMAGELKADVVTLGLPSDVEALHKRGLVADNWAARLPYSSQPYHSTIVFVVRRGNPHGIADWPDLLKAGVEVVTPDPKTSGNGKLTGLAAWGAVTTRGGGERDRSARFPQGAVRSCAVSGAGRAGGGRRVRDRAARQRPCCVGERSAARNGGVERRIGDRLPACQHPCRTERRLGRCKCRQEEQRRAGAGLSRIPLHR